MSDLRTFFASSGVSASKTASGNKPPLPKQIKDPNAHKDGGPKVTTSKKIVIVSSGEEEEQAKPKAKGKARASTVKRTKDDDDFLDDEDDDLAPKRTKKPPTKKIDKPPAKKVKREDEVVQDGADKKPKSKWQPKQSTGPVAPGSKEIPEGEPDCLAGLTLVFTGELDSIGREEAQNLAKKYSARVTTGPSSKTDYVIMGRDAGPKKLETIKKYKLKVLNEDEFLQLIASRGAGDIDEKTIKKRQEEEKKVIENAKTIAPPKESKDGQKADQSQLWTVKYAPTSIKDLCGNKSNVEKLQDWLHNWDSNRKSGFKKPGKNMTGMTRCLVLAGPPGVGKTTAAHLVARAEGFDVLELNASDTRSKKLFEAAMKDVALNTGIASHFCTGDANASDRLVLIMDEVDGMSAGDRGGVGALTALIRKTRIPIIAIANDMSLPKMRPLKNSGQVLQFRRPDVNQIRSRMMSIAFREGLKVAAAVMDQLVKGTNQDIRQVLNMLSTYKLSAGNHVMTFDESLDLVKVNEKNVIQSPWSLYQELFSPRMFGPNDKTTLNQKTDFYFQDHDIMPLFVQDNYLKNNFTLAANTSGPARAMKELSLMSKAADAIVDGDLVDRMIHGPQQHWSLMPLHGIFSCVRPAFHCHGSMSQNGGGGWGMAFPSWFGKNSTQGKLNRLLGEVQIRMRLKVSGDRQEIRQNYLPLLHQRLLEPLVESGAEGVDEIIALMDEYYLAKEEWEAIMEIVSIGKDWEATLKKVPPAVKSKFTRTFNSQAHPIAFHKTSDLAGKPQKKLSGDSVPDHEDAIQEEAEISDDDGQDDEDDDISKDKLIKSKAAKKTNTAKGGASGAGKGRGRAPAKKKS